jgi:uncharacterized membrane protein
MTQESALAVVDALGRVVELVGVVVLIVGMAWAAVLALLVVARGRRGVPVGTGPYWTFRASLARAILLGLEILIAADIILTVTVDTTVESALALVLIVFVRVALSFTLTVEVEGRWPWQPPREASAISPRDPI